MAKRRTLTFSNESDVIADVNRLRAGYERVGNWTLPQVCFHLAYPLEQSLRRPDSTEPTAEQLQIHGFLDQVIAEGWPAKVLEADAAMLASADAGDEMIPRLFAALQRMERYDQTHVDAIFFGPLPIEKFRRFALIHAAHHLSFLVPTK